MIDFGIPNDSIMLRRKTFKKLINPQDTSYVDGAMDYDLLIPFADEYSANTETRLWMAYLYGLSYSCTTVMRIVTEFPDLQAVKPKKIKKFWEDYKNELWFQPDKRYLKNNNQVIPAIKSLYQVSQKGFSEYFIPVINQGFDIAYKEILKNWDFFGPMGAYLFFDALYGLLPDMYSDPDALDWKNCGKTVPEGMAILLGLDEQAVHEEPYDIPLYNKTVNTLSSKYNQPKIVIESTLCAFRKLFKGTRYFGYYADRQLCECSATAKLLRKHCGVDIWKYRGIVCPEYLRGEIGGWKGIRKDRCKIFLNTGSLTGDDQ